MSQELGKMERPLAEDYQQGRKLFFVPLIFSPMEPEQFLHGWSVGNAGWWRSSMSLFRPPCGATPVSSGQEAVFNDYTVGKTEIMGIPVLEYQCLVFAAIEDLANPLTFLVDIQRSILRCCEVEGKAFEVLCSVATR